MKTNIFRTKKIEDVLDMSTHHNQLRRSLGAFNITTMGVGAIVGAGIYVVTGAVASDYTGPAIMISYLIAAILCTIIALCYSELSSAIPVSGSTYSYSYLSIGEIGAWFVGWNIILTYLAMTISISIGWSGYFVGFLEYFKIFIPSQYTASPFSEMIYIPNINDWVEFSAAISYDLIPVDANINSYQHLHCYVNLPAILIGLVITFILLRGTKESARFNNIVVGIKILVILLFSIIGVFFIDYSNFTPFIPKNTGKFGEYGISGIFNGVSIIFLAYLGFDAITTVAQEVKNPKKNLPLGIIGSLLISTFIYIIVSFVLTGVVNYTKLDVPDPIAVGVSKIGSNFMWLSYAVSVAAIIGLLSGLLVFGTGLSRVLYSMSHDGLVPKLFGKVNPVKHIPSKSILIVGITISILSGFIPFVSVIEMVSIGTLASFVFISVCVILLRKNQPLLNRPYKMPLVPLLPLIGAFFSFIQMFILALNTWIIFLSWMAVSGLPRQMHFFPDLGSGKK